MAENEQQSRPTQGEEEKDREEERRSEDAIKCDLGHFVLSKEVLSRSVSEFQYTSEFLNWPRLRSALAPRGWRQSGVQSPGGVGVPICLVG